MIAVVEGVPGSGKSFSCVCRIAQALDAGKVVATNVELTPGWETVLAKSNGFRRLIPGGVRKAEASYRRRVFVSGDLDELMRVRIPGTKEGRGVMVLDEAHNWCNARSWTDGDRDRLVRFFSQHRKLGWDVYLISQRAENIDAQIRSLAEYRITLRNLKRFKLAGVPLLPFNFFLAIWQWEGGVRTIVKRESYRLRKKMARCYDTLATSHGLEADDFDPIWLPGAPELASAETPVLKQGQDPRSAPEGRTEADRPVSDAVTHAPVRRGEARSAPPPPPMPAVADPSASASTMRALGPFPPTPPERGTAAVAPATVPGSLADAAAVSPATE